MTLLISPLLTLIASTLISTRKSIVPRNTGVVINTRPRPWVNLASSFHFSLGSSRLLRASYTTSFFLPVGVEKFTVISFCPSTYPHRPLQKSEILFRQRQ